MDNDNALGNNVERGEPKNPEIGEVLLQRITLAVAGFGLIFLLTNFAFMIYFDIYLPLQQVLR